MFMMAACMSAGAMSFSRAQAEALYLTDKMAYELNLNDQQYNDAYEINLDYFLRVDSPSDVYGSYYSYRLNDLRCILHDWQYSLLAAADYFLRPIVWRAGGWSFPVYGHYRPGHFYYSRPSVYVSYRGGHSRSYHHAGFYVNRRPHQPSAGMHHPVPGNHRPSSGMRDSRPSPGSPRADYSPSRSHGGPFAGSSSRGSIGSSRSGSSRGGGSSRGSIGSSRGGGSSRGSIGSSRGGGSRGSHR